MASSDWQRSCAFQRRVRSSSIMSPARALFRAIEHKRSFEDSAKATNGRSRDDTFWCCADAHEEIEWSIILQPKWLRIRHHRRAIPVERQRLEFFEQVCVSITIMATTLTSLMGLPHVQLVRGCRSPFPQEKWPASCGPAAILFM